MTPTYIRKTQTTYTEEQLQLSVEQIKKYEISLSKASGDTTYHVFTSVCTTKSNHRVEVQVEVQPF